MSKIDTILFDLDGTLISSIELIIITFEKTFKHYMPERTFSRQDFIDMIGPPLKETFKIKSLDPKTIEEMIQFYRDNYIRSELEYIDIYPNVKETIKLFYERGYNLGVVTTKFKVSATPSLEHYGLTQYLTGNCYEDDITHHKPHPEPIFYALKQFDHYDTVLMVGDTASDIMAGRNAGALTCAVDWSIKRKQIEEIKPDFWISDFKQLIEIVDEYNKEESL
ncbi:MAG: HAD-IA family hydrolase [Bacilli bacterium]|nr:HAD-IA family hydrolase [Bacilli bacterium]